MGDIGSAGDTGSVEHEQRRILDQWGDIGSAWDVRSVGDVGSVSDVGSVGDIGSRARPPRPGKPMNIEAASSRTRTRTPCIEEWLRGPLQSR